MKSPYVHFLHFFLFIFTYLFLSSCESWNLEQKNFTQCTPPSASIAIKSSQGLKLKFSLENSKGTIDKITWNIDGGKFVQVGDEISYTFSNSGLYNISVELTNKCGNSYTTQIQTKVFDIYSITLPPESLGSNSALFQIAINGKVGNNSISQYGVCYSSTYALPTIEKSQILSKNTTPLIGTTYGFESNDLKENTKYYFRSFISINNETIYGDVLNLTTSPYISGISKLTSPPIMGVEGSISFSIGDKIYTCFGKDITGAFTTNLWEYNTITEVWTRRANFPDNGRTKSSVFVINNIAYVGLGYQGGASSIVNEVPIYNEVSDFWKYDPLSDIWTQIANFPAGNRAGACGFSINNKGYIVGGGYSKNTGTIRYGYFKDTWEYNPTTDTWIQKANFGGGESSELYGTSALGKGYIGLGQTLDPLVGSSTGLVKLSNDLWEYNPLTNRWLNVSSFPAQSSIIGYPKMAFTIQNKTYFIFFKTNNSVTVYMYSPSTGLSSIDYSNKITGRYNGIATATARSGFFGLGASGEFGFSDFYLFNP